MDRSRGAGVSPPLPRHARAGMGEAGVMVTRRQIVQLGFIMSLPAVLASGISMEPQQAIARPVYTGGPDGNPYGSGDPTGEDIPSPTPKPGGGKGAAAPAPVRGSQGTHSRW